MSAQADQMKKFVEELAKLIGGASTGSVAGSKTRVEKNKTGGPVFTKPIPASTAKATNTTGSSRPDLPGAGLDPKRVIPFQDDVTDF
jgi:hypothetical protein